MHIIKKYKQSSKFNPKQHPQSTRRSWQPACKPTATPGRHTATLTSLPPRGTSDWPARSESAPAIPNLPDRHPRAGRFPRGTADWRRFRGGTSPGCRTVAHTCDRLAGLALPSSSSPGRHLLRRGGEILETLVCLIQGGGGILPSKSYCPKPSPTTLETLRLCSVHKQAGWINWVKVTGSLSLTRAISLYTVPGSYSG